MSLESILNRILAAARDQAAEIIQEATREQEALVREARSQADQLYQEALKEARVRYERAKQLGVVKARLENRKKLLLTKQELIDGALNKVQAGLKREAFKKQQVWVDKIKEVPEDLRFYLAKFRQDYESEIANELFS